MNLTRREMLAASAGALAGLRAFAAEDPAPPAAERSHMGVVIHSYGLHIAASRDRGDKVPFSDPLNFLEHCQKLGAGGIQLGIGVRDKEHIAKLRSRVEALHMYLEGSISLPADRADVERFTAEVQTAKACGVAVLRTTTVGSRRYEAFDTAEAFRRSGERAYESLGLAEPVVARHDVRLAVENHKDWRVDELLERIKRISSRHVGICVDTGNSIALLEDPQAVVEAYAPWACSTHIKDMGVEEYEEGFLLSEVPLGTGFLDLKKMVRVLRQARPELHFGLEMITRDPLRIPCLTPKYWATMPDVSGKVLAQALTMVRQHAAKPALPRISKLGREKQLEIEEQNVRQCLDYARQELEL